MMIGRRMRSVVVLIMIMSFVTTGLHAGGNLVPKLETEEFSRYLEAVISVESAGNHGAISSKGAYGLMQITQVAMREASQQCGLPLLKDMRLLLEPVRNVLYGSCYLKYLLRQQNGNWTNALIIYNGGYAQLQKYLRGERIHHETANYVLQINRRIQTQK